MTDAKGEHPDMCVSLSGANWLVHSHPDECTTGRAREKSGQTTKRTGVMHGASHMSGRTNKKKHNFLPPKNLVFTRKNNYSNKKNYNNRNKSQKFLF